MVIQKKLIVVIAGLSLGACSSVSQNNTGMTFEDIQTKLQAHDESLQTIQVKLDRIDALESEVASLKGHGESVSSEDMMGAAEAMLTPEETLINIDDVAPMETGSLTMTPESLESETVMYSEPVVEPMAAMTDTMQASSMSEPSMTESSMTESSMTESSMAESSMTEPSMAESAMATAPIIEPAPMVTAPMVAQKPKTMTMQYGVQVASYVSKEKAVHGWEILIDTFPTRYDGLVPLINQKEVNGRVMNQLKVGPFVDRSFAVKFCMMMKRGGQDCLVTSYDGNTFL